MQARSRVVFPAPTSSSMVRSQRPSRKAVGISESQTGRNRSLPIRLRRKWAPVTRRIRKYIKVISHQMTASGAKRSFIRKISCSIKNEQKAIRFPTGKEIAKTLSAQARAGRSPRGICGILDTIRFDRTSRRRSVLVRPAALELHLQHRFLGAGAPEINGIIG